MMPRRALVTGGSGAIGTAICSALASTGLHVYVHANAQRSRAEETVASIRAAGGSAEAVVFDVTDAGACGAGVADILATGPIQVLVNNAGIHRDAVMAGMSHATWQGVIDVSLNGFFNVTQPLLLPMLRTRWGRIINMASIAGVMGNRGQTNYAAAKAGLIGATKSLALECASRGVTVNAVAPGIIDSPMIAEAFSPDRIKAMVPMQRAGRPEEVASLVAYLASDAAGYISGQVIGINGGMA
jgi:3-oxoacyl-[acyl-carrier protein] reductase